MDWHDEGPFFNFYQNICFSFRRLLRITLNWFMLMVTGKTELERIVSIFIFHTISFIGTEKYNNKSMVTQ